MQSEKTPPNTSVQAAVHTPGPWEHSEQKGSPGHCFVAQVWAPDGESLAVLDSTIDPAVATANAKLMAASPTLLAELRKAVDMLESTTDGDQPACQWWVDEVARLRAFVDSVV